MTTVQSMLARRIGLPAALVCSALAFPGCLGQRDQLIPPEVLVSPYLPQREDVLLAVAPLANESGVSTVDVLQIGDELVAAISEARGLSALPMNRSLAAMSAKRFPGIRTPEEARALARALGADGIVVGSVTAYDPYDPPKIGLSLALVMNDRPAASNLDPHQLSGAYTDRPAPGPTTFGDRPDAAVIEHLDAANHEVLLELKEYAKGRHDPRSALTWRRYTASMELYTEFAAYHTVRRLLDQERTRIGQMAAAGDDRKEQK